MRGARLPWGFGSWLLPGAAAPKESEPHPCCEGPVALPQTHQQRKGRQSRYLSSHRRAASCINVSAAFQRGFAFRFIRQVGQLGKSEFH